ncbi:MAG: riboflavin kinase/FMN adenylyltransferase [Oleiphilaceae bacterium]|jgi:riboflavin kinase/FMN adenylyltransferase
MRLLRGLHNPSFKEAKCVATIGNFDGVHLGHQAIIQQVVTKAEDLGVPSVVIIFEPQPLEFFQGNKAPARLMRFREKLQALSTFGIDYVFCLKFDSKLSQLSAPSFVETVLVSHLKVCHLVVGDDFHFGGDRKGDFSLLQSLGQIKGFSVESTSTIFESGLCGERISSTFVRALLAQSKFVAAHNVLGRPYSIAGRVVHGQKLGRQLGFPTANIALHRINVAFTGVYAVKACLQSGEQVLGVANIGVKPTVGNFIPSLEIHLLDFSSTIYGEHLDVTFCEKLRNEQRFENIEALKEQINKDINDARCYFLNNQQAPI